MKNSYTQKFGIAVTALALFMASCGSNATFSKRYHNRGFNIAWGGGASGNSVKANTRVNKHNSNPSELKVLAEAEKTASVDVPVTVETSQIEANQISTAASNPKVSNCAVKKASTSALSKKEITNERAKLSQLRKSNSMKKGSSKLSGSEPGGPIFGILSLVFGILGWVTLPLLFGLAAIVLGIIGLRKEMNGLAIAGLILGSLLLIIMVLVVAVLLAM
jgi:hypothetical protein